MDLSQFKTFQLVERHKLENLPMEFEKLQSLVELDLFGCFELGCLPHSNVDYHKGVKRYSIDIGPPKWRKTICCRHIRRFMKLLEASMC